MTTENQDVSEAGAGSTEGTGGEGQDSNDQSVTNSIEDAENTNNSNEDGEGTKPEINWEEKFNHQETNYKELQRKFTEVTQDRSSMRNEFKALQDAMKALQGSVSEVTKKPLPSPEEFIKAIQTDGIGAIQPFLDDKINPMKESYEKELASRDDKIMKLESDFECMIRRTNSDQYPDFAKLEPEIKQLAADPKCPVDWNRSTGEVIDTLYNLVRAKHSSDALNAATAAGAKKEQERLANEANAGVAGGGKANSASTPDYSKVKDIEKLREMLIDKFGIADRD